MRILVGLFIYGEIGAYVMLSTIMVYVADIVLAPRLVGSPEDMNLEKRGQPIF